MNEAENKIASLKDKLKLRLADSDDMAIYFEWVNDIDVRQQSFNSTPILWEDHQEWFKNKLLLQNCLMLVMELDSQPVGQIRFDFKDEVAYIDYSLDKKVRGKHWARILVDKGILFASRDNNVTFQAQVKQDNIASIRVFEKLGFSEKDGCKSGVRLFYMYLNDKTSSK